MNTITKSIRHGLFRTVLTCIGAAALSYAAQAQISIAVANGDFSNLGNEESRSPNILGVLGSYDKEFGSGPWSADADGILNVIAAPSMEIGSGEATISGIANISAIGGLGGIASNEGRFYQNDIGANFIDGYTYTLTAEVSSSASLAGLDLIGGNGVGIGLLSNGSSTPTTGTGGTPLISLSLLEGAETGTLTYIFQASGSEAGNSIGVELYSGRDKGIASAGIFPEVSFDNVTLTAVPEPSTVIMLGGATLLALLLGSRSRRSRLAKAN